MNNDQAIEQQIQAKGLTAPRVTPEDIAANIHHIETLKHVTQSGQVFRWAILVMQSGFGVVGEPSVAVSPENDDAEIGEQVAFDNSREEMWPLMGFALKQKLHEQAALEPTFTIRGKELPPHQNRVMVEAAELADKVEKLTAFTVTPMFDRLDPDEQGRLRTQLVAMRTYGNILGERIAAF